MLKLRYRSGKNSIILSTIVFKILLDIIYLKYIVPIFYYNGFTYSLDIFKYILSWSMLFPLLILIKKVNKQIKFSSIIISSLFYLSFVPFTTMVAFYPFSYQYIIINYLYWIILIYLYIKFPRIKVVKIRNEKIIDLFILIIISGLCLVIIFIWAKYAKFRINLNIFNVYDYRMEARTFDLPILIEYIYMATKLINPILIVYFLERKKISISLLIFIVQILSFSINGSKTVLFSSIIVLLLYWLYNERYILNLPHYLSLISFIGILEFFCLKSFAIINVVIRRVYFIPNLLGYYYFDYFTKHSPDYFKQSFLKYFRFSSEYPKISRLIGEVYFNKPEMAANNGLISDAYANLGVLGILIMPLIIVITLKILDSCTEGLNTKIFIISALTLAFVFLSSFFFTILLTHGLLGLCIILYLLPKNSGYKGER